MLINPDTTNYQIVWHEMNHITRGHSAIRRTIFPHPVNNMILDLAIDKDLLTSIDWMIVAGMVGSVFAAILLRRRRRQRSGQTSPIFKRHDRTKEARTEDQTKARSK